MKIFLNNPELALLYSLIQRSHDSASVKKNLTIEDNKQLEICLELLEKIKWVVCLPQHEGEITINRVQAKQLLGMLKRTVDILHGVRQIYNEAPENDQKFRDEEGRRKADYVGGIDVRLQLVSSVVTKIEKEL